MVRLNNVATPAGKRGGQDYYHWRVFVDEPESVLSQIEEVEYVLHPTFPKPEQRVTNAAEQFSLEASGWGEFTILAHVKFRDGHTEEVTYGLDLTRKP